jgi:hypothetical protein
VAVFVCPCHTSSPPCCSLPFVVFREHSRDPSCAHLPINQLFCQNPINGGSGNLGHRNAEIIECDAPFLTHDSLNLRDCLIRNCVWGINGKDGIINKSCWSSISSNLNPYDFYLWGKLESIVYANNPQDVEAVKQNLQHSAMWIVASFPKSV